MLAYSIMNDGVVVNTEAVLDTFSRIIRSLNRMIVVVMIYRC